MGKALLDWIVNNNEVRLVEEAEDMLDGLQVMTEEKETGMREEILIQATDIVTALVIAGNLDLGKVSFQKDGKADQTFLKDGKLIRRVGRAERMKKIRVQRSSRWATRGEQPKLEKPVLKTLRIWL